MTAGDEQVTLLSEENLHVELTGNPLDVLSIMNRVRSPKAGAIVFFAGAATITSRRQLGKGLWKLLMPVSGTTRDTFGSKPVKQLQYSSYTPMALSSMMRIAKDVKQKHGLTAVAMIHRLGVVPIGEESILIAVSSPHRQAAWKGGEEALELVKEKVEIWKLEEFDGEEGGVWRANRDGQSGTKIR